MLAALAEAGQMRPATKAEIMAYLGGSSALQAGPDGFSYKVGGRIGYKISNGGICVLSPSRAVDCVAVRTDGSTFQMIDRTGTRQKF